MQHQNKRQSSLEQRWTWKDYYMLVNMVLFLIVGSITIYRAFFQHAHWLVYLMGLGFLSAGGYRLYLFYQTLLRK